MRWASETFGRRLAQIRTDRRLTQGQLGVAVGKSKRTISDWENSPFVEIWLGDVAQCARALRCQVKDLLAPVDEPIPPYPLLWPRTRRRLATSARSAPPAIE
jgi:transcriptional regulator with XRE-family HTH domain